MQTAASASQEKGGRLGKERARFDVCKVKKEDVCVCVPCGRKVKSRGQAGRSRRLLAAAQSTVFVVTRGRSEGSNSQQPFYQ